MKNFIIMVTLVASVFVLRTGTGWSQGGVFVQELERSICSKMPTFKNSGCRDYLFFRIQELNTPNSAKGRCLSRCQYGMGHNPKPVNVENCKKGCEETHTIDLSQ